MKISECPYWAAKFSGVRPQGEGELKFSTLGAKYLNISVYPYQAAM